MGDGLGILFTSYIYIQSFSFAIVVKKCQSSYFFTSFFIELYCIVPGTSLCVLSKYTEHEYISIRHKQTTLCPSVLLK